MGGSGSGSGSSGSSGGLGGDGGSGLGVGEVVVGELLGDGDPGGDAVVGLTVGLGEGLTDGDAERVVGAGGTAGVSRSPASPCAIRKMPVPSITSSTSAVTASSTGGHHRRGAGSPSHSWVSDRPRPGPGGRTWARPDQTAPSVTAGNCLVSAGPAGRTPSAAGSGWVSSAARWVSSPPGSRWLASSAAGSRWVASAGSGRV